MPPMIFPVHTPRRRIHYDEKVETEELPKEFDYFCPACLHQTNEFTVLCPKCGHEGLRESGKDRFRKIE